MRGSPRTLFQPMFLELEALAGWGTESQRPLSCSCPPDLPLEPCGPKLDLKGIRGLGPWTGAQASTECGGSLWRGCAPGPLAPATWTVTLCGAVCAAQPCGDFPSLTELRVHKYVHSRGWRLILPSWPRSWGPCCPACSLPARPSPSDLTVMGFPRACPRCISPLSSCPPSRCTPQRD